MQALRQEGSIENQRHRLRGFVDIKNLQETTWGKIIDTYIDDGVSAKNTNLPAFQRMMRDLRDGKINLILITDLSRLSRNILDFCLLHEDLKKYNAKFFSIKEQFDTTTAVGEMMVFNMINLAQFERNQTSERVTMNFHARAMRELRNGCHIPLGYESAPGDLSRMVILDTEAEDVRKIFAAFIRHEGLADTVKEPNQSGIRPKAVKHQNAHRNREGKWTTQTLQHVLRNSAYIGLREANRGNKDKDQSQLRSFEKYQIVKSSWPAIIEEETFKEAQLILDENLCVARARREKAEAFLFLVSGSLTCGVCGRPLMGATSHGNNGRHRYYRHRPDPGESSQCPMRFLRAEKFEERLLYQLDKILWQEGYLDGIEERIKKMSRQDHRAQPSALGNLTNELLSLEGEIDDAFRLQACVSDASTDEIFRQRLQKIQERKKSVEFQIAGIKSMTETAQDPAAQLEVIENNLIAFKKARGGANRQQLKRLIKRVVESITAYPDRLLLRYWTSNANRNSSHSQKLKRAPDMKSGALSINPPVSSLISTSSEVWDQRVPGVLLFLNGRAGGIHCALPVRNPTGGSRCAPAVQKGLHGLFVELRGGAKMRFAVFARECSPRQPKHLK